MVVAFPISTERRYLARDANRKPIVFRIKASVGEDADKGMTLESKGLAAAGLHALLEGVEGHLQNLDCVHRIIERERLPVRQQVCLEAVSQLSLKARGHKNISRAMDDLGPARAHPQRAATLLPQCSADPDIVCLTLKEVDTNLRGVGGARAV